MGNPIAMTLSEIDSAIARNIMKWRRLTLSAVQPDLELSSQPQQSGQSLDPRWFDREGRVVANAEATESREGPDSIWSPTKNAGDAQMVRSKLAELFQSIILARLAVGAMVLFALFVNKPVNGSSAKSHIAMGASEEIATSLCALATAGFDVEIHEDAATPEDVH